MFSRPPVEAHKQKYPCTLHRALIAEIFGWELASQKLESFQLPGWANRRILFLTSVTCKGEPQKDDEKPVWAVYSAIPYCTAKPVGHMPEWMMLQGWKMTPKAGDGRTPREYCGAVRAGSSCFTSESSSSPGQQSPLQLICDSLGWEPGKPCMKIKPCSWATPAVVPAPPKPPNLGQQCELAARWPLTSPPKGRDQHM